MVNDLEAKLSRMDELEAKLAAMEAKMQALATK